MGGYGVYQSYRRMLREEATEQSSENIIFYIWGDDHIRSLLRCRHADIYRRWDHLGGRMFHNNFWPNMELNLISGEWEEHENRLPTKESLYHMTDPEWMTENLREDVTLQLSAFKEGYTTTLDRDTIDKLAARLDFSFNWNDSSTLIRQAGELLDHYSLTATQFVLSKVQVFAKQHNKKIIVVLFDPYRVLTQMQRGDARYDQPIVDYLNREKFRVFDMNLIHLEDFKKYDISFEEYFREYFIGHYNPAGNHFFAYSFKDMIVDWLNPKPVTYSKADAQSIHFKGYLQGHE
jgi:hypothetical protein